MASTVLGLARLRSRDGGTISSVQFTLNPARGGDTRSRDRAVEYLKQQKVRWESSDQFVGETLYIEITQEAKA